jgi:hypothetical protein
MSRKLSLFNLDPEAGARLELRGRFGFPLRAAAVATDIEIAQYLLKK